MPCEKADLPFPPDVGTQEGSSPHDFLFRASAALRNPDGQHSKETQRRSQSRRIRNPYLRPTTLRRALSHFPAFGSHQWVRNEQCRERVMRLRVTPPNTHSRSRLCP